ncbi:hypothetical protein [Hufsiella ginkgonis]|uniref:Uncharacterized protein n=1 Tax=Hufsiella ginkgonis TaxID=2695274 RepID=A0A7K1XYF5_9SPHI|nr:hypothetical protein [Hufsiella ginkgonis]MXV15982.1 hypothetical protein [Hufsiella ginkgonis]
MTGTWAGAYLLPGVPNAHIILNLKQDGNTVKGTSKIYSDMDSMYVVYAIEGTINGNGVVLNDAGVADHNSKTNNYWCKRISKGTISMEGDSLVIRADVSSTGYGFSGNKAIRIDRDCAPGKFTVFKSLPKPVKSVVSSPAAGPRRVRLAITDRGIADNDRVTISFNGRPLSDVYNRPLRDAALTRNPLYADVVLSATGPNLLEIASTSTGKSATSTLLVTFWSKALRKRVEYTVDCSPGKNGAISIDQ